MNYGMRFVTLYRRQGSRPSPRKEIQESKMAEEALQIAVKRREAKSKGEKERYTHLNAEFQRIARKDNKAFSDNHFSFLHLFLCDGFDCWFLYNVMNLRP